MNRNQRIFAGLVCALGYGLLSCGEEPNAKTGKAYTGPTEEVTDAQVIYSEAGQLKVRMKTPLRYTYQNKDQVYPKQVNIEFYGPNQQIMTTLRADSGRYINGQDMYRVMGNVIVVNKQKNEELRTEELNWNPATKKVFTEKRVNIFINNTGERLEGDGLDASQDFSQYSIRKPTGVFRVKPGSI